MTEIQFNQFEDDDNNIPVESEMEVDAATEETESDEDDSNSSPVADMFSLYCFAIQLYHLARTTFTGYENEDGSADNEVNLDISDSPMVEDDSANPNGINLN